MKDRKINPIKKNKVLHFKKMLKEQENLAVYLDNGLNSRELKEIRAVARKNNITVFVEKNTLVKIATSEFPKNFKDNLKKKIVLLLSDDLIKPIGIHNSFSKEIKKFFVPLAVSNKNQCINNDSTISQLLKLKDYKGLLSNSLMYLNNPINSILKILEINGS